jgi:hypothetical protein
MEKGVQMMEKLTRCEFHDERWKLIFIMDQFGVVGHLIPRRLRIRSQLVRLRILRRHSSVLDWRADSVCIEEVEIALRPDAVSRGEYFRLQSWNLERLADSYFQVVDSQST